MSELEVMSEDVELLAAVKEWAASYAKAKPTPGTKYQKQREVKLYEAVQRALPVFGALPVPHDGRVPPACSAAECGGGPTPVVDAARAVYRAWDEERSYVNKMLTLGRALKAFPEPCRHIRRLEAEGHAVECADCHATLTNDGWSAPCASSVDPCDHVEESYQADCPPCVAKFGWAARKAGLDPRSKNCIHHGSPWCTLCPSSDSSGVDHSTWWGRWKSHLEKELASVQKRVDGAPEWDVKYSLGIRDCLAELLHDLESDQFISTKGAT